MARTCKSKKMTFSAARKDRWEICNQVKGGTDMRLVKSEEQGNWGGALLLRLDWNLRPTGRKTGQFEMAAPAGKCHLAAGTMMIVHRATW